MSDIFDQPAEPSSFNSAYATSKFDTQSSVVQDLVGGAIASVVDTGATLWNSLPGTEEVSTRDLLSNISQDAMRVYDEHPDAVALTSFIGGSLVGGGLAIKGMNALRAGAKGASWFSNAGKVANMAKIEEGIKMGSEGTQLVRSANLSLLRNGIANNVLDAAVAESVMLMTMNTHPMLEDYWEEPVKNMGISLAFGGVLGAGIGHIADRYAINSMKGTLEAAAAGSALKSTKGISEALPNIGRIQAHESNIQSLEKILHPDYTATTLEKEFAKSFLDDEKAAQLELFKRMSSPEIEELPAATRNAIMKNVVSNTDSAAGDSVKFFKETDTALDKAMTTKALKVKPASTFGEVATKNVDEATGVLRSIEDVVYFPSLKAYVHPDAAPALLKAVDQGMTPADIKLQAKSLPTGVIPDTDARELILNGKTSAVDADYLAKLHKVDGMNESQLSNFALDTSDLATMNALVAAYRKDPNMFRNFSAYSKTTETSPVIAQLNKDMEAMGKVPSLKQTKEVETRFNIHEIEDLLLTKKQAAINNMIKKGYGMETIHIRTNTPLKTVQAYVAGVADKTTGTALKDLMQQGDDLSPIMYSSVDGIEQYLATENRALRISSSIHKDGFVNMQAKLASSIDNTTLVNLNTEWAATVLGTSESTTARRIHESFFGSDLAPNGMRSMLDMLSSGINEVVNSNLGSAFFGSADFFLRSTSVGRLVTTIGKNLQSIASKSMEPITHPLTQAFSKVNTDPIALIEFNLAIDVASGVSGRKIYKEGSFWVEEQVLNATGKTESKLVRVKYEGNDFIVKTPSVQQALEALSVAGREAFHLKNTGNRIVGSAPISDLGFWTPSINPKDKMRAYVFDSLNRRTQLLWGHNEEDLLRNVEAYKAAKPLATTTRIVFPKEAQLYNELEGRLDTMTMEVANVAMKHTGSSQRAITRANSEIFGEIIGGYESFIESHVKRIGQYVMHDTIDALGKMSEYNKRISELQPLGTVAKLTQQKMDGAHVVRNILIGNGSLDSYQSWKHYNDVFETSVNMGLQVVNDTFKAVAGPLSGTFGKSIKTDAEAIARMDFKKVYKELEARGIPSPWGKFDEAAAKLFGVASVQESKNTTKRAIYASNAFAATYALRVLDLASPLVNAISMPIITSLAKMQNMPETLLGASKANKRIPSTMEIIFNGARASNSTDARWVALSKHWEKEGYFDSMISEANTNMRAARNFDKGIPTTIEKSIDNDFVNMLSKPADWTEAFLRRKMMFTGATLAKEMYPTLGDHGITVFARDFMDRALGNYHSSQRPVLFQGTAGVAMGLFQTYMLTLGQSVYRSLELKDYKALGKAVLMQSTVFGGQSLPGFDLVSTAIGDHFSDENIDLVSGTFRAIPDPMATAILYGLPSSLGPALYTRGEISPRIATPTGDPTKLAAVNMVLQTLDFGSNLAQAAKDNGGDISNSLGQAVSLQSVSRPLARVSELFTGYSVTTKGNTVSTPAEVYSFSGIAARLLSTRPTQEAKARELLHFNTVYGQLDRANRSEVTGELKQAARNGELSDERLERLAYQYMRKGGTSTGWKGAVNEAISGVDMNSTDKLSEKLKDDSPLMYMIDSMDGE